MVLETNCSSFKKNQKISLCKILVVSGGYLARDTLGLYSIVLLIHRMIALSEACQLVKSSSHLIGLWLAEIFKLGLYDIQAKIFRWQAP